MTREFKCKLALRCVTFAGFTRCLHPRFNILSKNKIFDSIVYAYIHNVILSTSFNSGTIKLSGLLTFFRFIRFGKKLGHHKFMFGYCM